MNEHRSRREIAGMTIVQWIVGMLAWAAVLCLAYVAASGMGVLRLSSGSLAAFFLVFVLGFAGTTVIRAWRERGISPQRN